MKKAAMNKAIKNTKAFEDFKAESSNQTNKQRDMKNVKEFVAAELEGLDKGFIATPENEDQLLAFAKANHGSNDIVLMYMAVQYGAKLAYENILERMDKQ